MNRLSDFVHSEGYGFVVDPEPWKREGIQGDPPNPASFTALLCRPSGVSQSLIVCVDDSLDQANACAHEIAGDRRGHEHTEKMLAEQSRILAGWLRRAATTATEE